MEFVDDSDFSVDITDVFCALVFGDFDVDVIANDEFASVLELE